VSIELQYTDGTTAVAPTRFALARLRATTRSHGLRRSDDAGGAGRYLRRTRVLVCRAAVDALLRTRIGEPESCAHFVTPIPSADNYELAEAVIPQLERPGVHVVSARSPHSIFTFSDSDRVTAESPRRHRTGWRVIANSEVGHRRCGFRHGYRLICTTA